MTHRATASFGKRHEYVAVAELLRREFDLPMTLVEDQHAGRASALPTLETVPNPPYLCQALRTGLDLRLSKLSIPWIGSPATYQPTWSAKPLLP
jgi:hypothetical protein